MAKPQSKLFLAVVLAGILPIAPVQQSVAKAKQASPSTGFPDYATLSGEIDQFTKRLESLRSQIDQTRFEPDALIDKLDFDADALVDFVSREVVFQPYSGLLRGTSGTLRARAGNSLDQSILLAYLLKSAGYDARIVRGELAPDDAARLLHSLREPAPANSLDYLDNAVKAFYPSAGSVPAASSDAASAAEAASIDQQLKSSLKSAGIQLKNKDVTSELTDLVKTYFWVQFRDGPAQAWQDAHPAFGASTPPASLKPLEAFTDSIPDAYQHTLTISAWIEQFHQGKITPHRIMADWTRPVANLQGVVLSFRNVPMNLNRDNAGDLAKVMESADIFLPTFNDSRAPGAMAFDLKGRTIDPMALGGGGGGVFKTLGDAMETAAGNVQGNEGGQPLLALHSMWLEFTFKSPDGAAATYRRYLVPPRDDHAQDTRPMAWALITEFDYMVNAGSEPLDYLADRYLATGIDAEPWFKAIVARSLEPDENTPFPKKSPPRDFQPLAQYWLMDSQPDADKGIVGFRATPNLVGVRHGFRDDSTAFTGIDVVAHRLEHLKVTDSGIESVPEAGLERGVWDTVVESLTGQSKNRTPKSIQNTMSVFRLAGQQGIATRVIPAGQVDRVKELGVDETARQFMRRDLQSGHVVITPASKPDGARMTAWWRVNPETGETLGMTSDGYGQEFIEELTETVSISLWEVETLNAVEGCVAGAAHDPGTMCCMITAGADATVSLGMGKVLGKVVGGAGSALFDILSFGTKEGTEALAKKYNVGEGMGLMPSLGPACEKWTGGGGGE